MQTFIFRCKQEKMGIELERLNAEHAIESREDGQELVSIYFVCNKTYRLIQYDKMDTFLYSVCHTLVLSHERFNR